MRVKVLLVMAILLIFGGGIWWNLRVVPSENVRQESYWQSLRQKSLDERVFPASVAVLSFLKQHGHGPNLMSVHDVDFENDVRAALLTFPEPLRRLLQMRCAGLLVVSGLGVSAATYAIRSDEGVETQAFVILDRDRLSFPFQFWMQEKESRFFDFQNAEELKFSSVPDGRNTRTQTLTWLLLHESGHVAQIGDAGVPSFDQRPDVADFRQFAFTHLSWLIDEHGRLRSKFDQKEFTDRTSLPFRGQRARLSSQKIPEFFRQLQLTNFVSFEAAGDPFEDFAESFAHYVYVEKMDQTWGLQFFRQGKLVSSLKSCWNEARCQLKKSYLEQVWSRMERL